MIDIGTRKHGPFDPRYPRPRTRVASPGVERTADRELLDTWEGEGGNVESRTRANGRGNGHRPLQPETLGDGLSWERFYEHAYPGKRRHYFPAIAPWYGCRDRDRSTD